MPKQEIPREELDDLMKWAQSHLELEAPQELPIDLLHAARKFYGLPPVRFAKGQSNLLGADLGFWKAFGVNGS